MEAGPLRVLIAEDDFLVAKVIEGELDQLDVEVVGRAGNGRAAVELVCSVRPDVVLMDVQMPVLDGITAAAEIQERCPTPVVMLTVYSEEEVAVRAAGAGVGAYLVKPSSAAEMMRAITVARARFADLMELRRVNAELRAALASVRTLSGLLPICCNCKKIRDDAGYWRQVETYVSQHSSAEFTHSICPECTELLYPPEEFPDLYDADTAGRKPGG